jgi:hypothetical protein
VGPHRYIDVGLELEIEAEPIAGRIRHTGAAPRPFGGWLELAAALEDALREGRQIPEGNEPAAPSRRQAPAQGDRAKDT